MLCGVPAAHHPDPVREGRHGARHLSRRLRRRGRTHPDPAGLRLGCPDSILPRVRTRPRGPLWEEEPMTLDDSLLALRLRVMRRAEELKSVSAACGEAGIIRTVFAGSRDGAARPRRRAARGAPCRT